MFIHTLHDLQVKMTISSTALAFKIQAEPGWRGVYLIYGDLAEGQSELRHVIVVVDKIWYWGLFKSSRKVSPLDGLSGLFGGGGPEFEPLDSDGNRFTDLRRIVSPADTISNDELIAEMTATLQKKT